MFGALLRNCGSELFGSFATFSSRWPVSEHSSAGTFEMAPNPLLIPEESASL